MLILRVLDGAGAVMALVSLVRGPLWLSLLSQLCVDDITMGLTDCNLHRQDDIFLALF